jgi:hypothetical protein
MLIVPIVFTPTWFHGRAFSSGKKGFDEREIGAIAVSRIQASTNEPDGEGHAGHAREFALALCPACVDQVKAAYLRAVMPRNIRAAGALFSGAPCRQSAKIRIPQRTTADDELWVTLKPDRPAEPRLPASVLSGRISLGGSATRSATGVSPSMRPTF